MTSQPEEEFTLRIREIKKIKEADIAAGFHRFLSRHPRSSVVPDYSIARPRRPVTIVSDSLGAAETIVSDPEKQGSAQLMRPGGH